MKKVLLSFILIFIYSSLCSASNTAIVEGIRFSNYKNHTRVVIDLKGGSAFNSNRLKSPERLYFDLKGSKLSKNTKPSLDVSNGIIKKIRTGQFKKNIVRVTLDLEGHSMYSAFVLESPDRLVIDVYKPKKTGPSKSKTTRKERKKIEAPADAEKPERKQEYKRIETIVIDAGHGGKDPGAIGQKGLKEKDVVLDVAMKLGRLLEERHGIKVIYTRQNDTFIPLNDRTDIANSKGADLFISIHANANKKRSARGIETYILNWTNDDESIKVAARENNISISKMKLLRGSLQMILDDLARSHKKKESVRLARTMQDSMVHRLKDRYRNTKDLGVKQALFYVLLGAEMPSALVEISFISNIEEERLLSSKSYRKMISEGIAKGIGSYINGSTLMVKNEQGLLNTLR